MVHLALLILTGLASRYLMNKRKKKKKAAKDLEPLSRLLKLVVKGK